MTTAYAWRSGQIEFGRKVPEGSISLVTGPEKKVRAAIETVARHAYDGETLLVPGVPEATTDQEAFQALMKFAARVKEILGK